MEGVLCLVGLFGVEKEFYSIRVMQDKGYKGSCCFGGAGGAA